MSSGAAPKISHKPFTTKVDAGILLITCPMMIGEDLDAVLKSEIKTWLLAPEKVHVIDIIGVQKLPLNVVRTLLQYAKDLRSGGKQFFMIQLSDRLSKYLADQGLRGGLNPLKDLNEARQKSGLSEPAPAAGPKAQIFDVEVIQPFVKATESILGTMVNLKVEPLKPYVKTKDPSPKVDIAGVINMNTPGFCGVIAVCFSETMFLKVYERMVGEVHTSINDEVTDAAGEILNIIFGQAKTVLKEEKGFPVESAIPTVLTGTNIEVKFRSPGPTIILPFNSELGPFHMEIAIERSQKK